MGDNATRKKGLLDLPPELRNRIFAYAMRTDLMLCYMVMCGKMRILHVESNDGEIAWFNRATSSAVGIVVATTPIPGLLGVSHQIRAETAPLFYYKNQVRVHCYESELHIVATWLSKQIDISGKIAFDGNFALRIEHYSRRMSQYIWPIVHLAHSKHVQLGVFDRCKFPAIQSVRCQVFVAALNLAKKASDEGGSEAAFEQDFKQLMRRRQSEAQLAALQQ